MFHSHAADLATRISKAHDRYAATGQALHDCAEQMQDAQQRAYAAVWQANRRSSRWPPMRRARPARRAARR